MEQSVLKQAIINRVEFTKTVKYASWTIGLTHDPLKRRKQHAANGQSTKYWNQWSADSLSDALAIESHFINTKGMQRGTDGALNTEGKIYVYIF